MGKGTAVLERGYGTAGCEQIDAPRVNLTIDRLRFALDSTERVVA
jgi:hypothetical protein